MEVSNHVLREIYRPYEILIRWTVGVRWASEGGYDLRFTPNRRQWYSER